MKKPPFNREFSFELRNSPFLEESRFVVMTGAPISGKTTILDALGVDYEPEIARFYIERELAKGRTKEEVRCDESTFQETLVNMKLELESSLPKGSLRFFDRGMPDSITYYRVAGLDPAPILEKCKRVRYAAVFQFDPLPEEMAAEILACDAVRTEDLETRKLIDEYLERDYSATGYRVIRVPVMPVVERAGFVKTELSRIGIPFESSV